MYDVDDVGDSIDVVDDMLLLLLLLLIIVFNISYADLLQKKLLKLIHLNSFTLVMTVLVAKVNV